MGFVSYVIRRIISSAIVILAITSLNFFYSESCQVTL